MKVQTFIKPQFHATVNQDKADLYEQQPFKELIELSHIVFNSDAGRKFLEKMLETFVLNDSPHTSQDTMQDIMWREGRNDVIRTLCEWSLWGKSK